MVQIFYYKINPKYRYHFYLFSFLSHSSLQIEWVICSYICLAIRDMKINWGSVHVYITLDLDQFHTSILKKIIKASHFWNIIKIYSFPISYSINSNINSLQQMTCKSNMIIQYGIMKLLSFITK